MEWSGFLSMLAYRSNRSQPTTPVRSNPTIRSTKAASALNHSRTRTCTVLLPATLLSVAPACAAAVAILSYIGMMMMLGTSDGRRRALDTRAAAGSTCPACGMHLMDGCIKGLSEDARRLIRSVHGGKSRKASIQHSAGATSGLRIESGEPSRAISERPRTHDAL